MNVIRYLNGMNRKQTLKSNQLIKTLLCQFTQKLNGGFTKLVRLKSKDIVVQRILTLFINNLNLNMYTDYKKLKQHCNTDYIIKDKTYKVGKLNDTQLEISARILSRKRNA